MKNLNEIKRPLSLIVKDLDSKEIDEWKISDEEWKRIVERMKKEGKERLTKTFVWSVMYVGDDNLKEMGMEGRYRANELKY